MRPVDTDQQALAARFRVARAFAGVGQVEAGEWIGLSKRQWSRYEAGDWKDSPSSDILERVAQRSGVPVWFMRGGWDADDRDPSLSERVEAVEHRIDTVAAIRERLDALDREVTALRADAVRARLREVAGDQGSEAASQAPDKPDRRDQDEEGGFR